ncbi:MAG: hypothetical protein NC453_14720 [Muribaculum sp.]|nr:hypothetical protein [Muribaculum sp.]
MNEEWITKTDHLVLFMDIMGFKNRVERTDLVVLMGQLSEFKTKNIKLSPLLKNGKQQLIAYSQFSDSIVLVTRGCSKEDLNRLTKAAVILMQIGMQSGFALKGCISKGEMIYSPNNQLFFGKALVDAYMLEEELKFYGVVYHHSVEELIHSTITNQLIHIKGREKYIPIYEAKVNLKTGCCYHYTVAWHLLKEDLSKGDVSDIAKDWLKKIAETVSGNPRIYLANTRTYIEDIRLPENA